MRSSFVYKRRSTMATYNAEEVIDEHEFELLNQLEEELIFYLVSLGEEGRRERRWEVRPINTRREEQGEFVLVREMRRIDPEQHFKYFRMSANRFYYLVRRISTFIHHEPTTSDHESLKERLAVTLQIGASGSL